MRALIYLMIAGYVVLMTTLIVLACVGGCSSSPRVGVETPEVVEICTEVQRLGERGRPEWRCVDEDGGAR